MKLNWPAGVERIYEESVSDLGGDSYALLYGPSMGVWMNLDFSADMMTDCLTLSGRSMAWMWDDFTDHELAVVKRSLIKVKALQMEEAK